MPSNFVMAVFKALRAVSGIAGFIALNLTVVQLFDPMEATVLSIPKSGPERARQRNFKMRMGKIDTHHHYFPKVYVDAVGWEMLAAAMPNGKAPDWSVEAALQMMDVNGIAEAILSVSAGPRIPDAPTLLRKCNDYGTELRSKHPGCFGLFASLPLPQVGAALEEVR